MNTTEYASIEAFYDDLPERRRSGEADFGVHWHNGRIAFPRWRVSYVQATGEVYAVEQAHPCRVLVLGVVPPDEEGRYYATLDKILHGWAEQPVMRLSWVKARLNDRPRIEEARDPRPTLDDARHQVNRSGGWWTHPDPARVCETQDHRHKTDETAASCEYNSLLIAWKRRKAARKAA